MYYDYFDSGLIGTLTLVGDDAGLYKDMIGVQFPLHRLAVGRGRPVQVLVTIAPFQRLHELHPEMVVERAKDMHRLLEGELDLEAQPIQADDVDGVQRGVC